MVDDSEKLLTSFESRLWILTKKPQREDDWINNDDDITINNNGERYFNITSDEFFSNIFSSINVLSKVELETAQETGDLYGPIWVTATVIFILFFSNTGAHKLNNWLSGSDESYEYDFALFTGAISLLYGYTVVIPIFLYVVSVFYFKLIGFLSLTKIVSIYGYANSVWAPAAILAMFRGFFSNGFISSVILWAAVLIGGGISGAAILSKLYPIIRNAAVASDNGKLKTIYLVVLILAHIGFTIGVRSILIL
ncbi:hypothetical protein WICMUC_005202 [Wickerhamomyces mucosus]|uniref:Protein YIP n=1 Tax=Wickerhamomyces mucosus TaxID=1378264 RepID=A0A9P8P9C6_9ASCO|nr:hypothetical protein WICMUC_005202 [Wickerhamomyces mucosus]